jgi:ATP-dependent exoDNAse (exonuclease V) alpha subunit
VAAAAYRAAKKIFDRRTGLTHDFTKKGGVVHSEIMLPDHAPRDFADRAILWNAVEQAERQKNAQTAREVELALPAELPRAEQIALAREYVQHNFVDKGMCADLCVHDKKDGNPHAHILLTTRPLNLDGSWGAKSRKEYMLDRNGQRIMLESGEYKSRKIPATDWDSHENAERWRAAWAQDVNRAYERHGLEQTVDHRSYQRQGLALEPTQHMGKTTTELERQGVVTEIGSANREKTERNRAIRAYDETHHIERGRQEHARRPSYDDWHQQEQKVERGWERSR